MHLFEYWTWSRPYQNDDAFIIYYVFCSINGVILYQLNYEWHNDYIILHCLSSVDVNPPSSSISKPSNLDLILLSSSVECKEWGSFSSEAILDFLVCYRWEVIWITTCLVISVYLYSISAIFAHFVAIFLLVPLHSITVITMNN